MAAAGATSLAVGHKLWREMLLGGVRRWRAGTIPFTDLDSELGHLHWINLGLLRW